MGYPLERKPRKDSQYETFTQWIAQGWPYMHPVQDMQAQNLAVRSGFKSRSEVVSEQGYDSEQIDDEIAADNRRADELTLQYDSDGRLSSKPSTQPSSDKKDDSQNEQETAEQ